MRRGSQNDGLRGKAQVLEHGKCYCGLGDSMAGHTAPTRSGDALSGRPDSASPDLLQQCQPLLHDKQQEEASADLLDEVMMKERADEAHHLVGHVVESCAGQTCR